MGEGISNSCFHNAVFALRPSDGQRVEEFTLALENWQLNKPSFSHKMCNTWLGAILYSVKLF